MVSPWQPCTGRAQRAPKVLGHVGGQSSATGRQDKSEKSFQRAAIVALWHTGRMVLHFNHQGKCCANMHTDDLDIDGPAELLNLDAGKKMSLGRQVQQIRYGAIGRAPRSWYLESELKRSNETRPGRMFIDPYGATTGNLWSENYEQNRYQTGGQTSLAGRSKLLKITPLRENKLDRRQMERSRFLLDTSTQLGERFAPPLKPVCKRGLDIGIAAHGPGRCCSHGQVTPSPIPPACPPPASQIRTTPAAGQWLAGLSLR